MMDQMSRNAQELVLTDHNYTRQDVFGFYLRPTRNLFVSKETPSNYHHDVDIESEPPQSPPEYDVQKSRQVMDECEQFVMFARTARLEESSEDWEETISRVGWSAEQNSIFQRIVKILHADRLARLSFQGAWSEPAKRRSSVDRSAQRFRELFASVSWDARLTQWLHNLLVDHLDIAYLAAYLDILQALRVRIPTLVDRLVASSTSGKARIVQEGMKLLLKRPWDPAAKKLSSQKLGKLPGNPVIILIPSYLKKRPSMSPRCHLWSSHLSQLATFLPVVPTLGTISSKMTPPAYLEQMMSATKARLASARTEYPAQPVIVVGWRSGAAVALQIAASETVTAVVALGFATRTVEGPRGDPDDSIYSITCPVLFVSGDQAGTARIEEIEEIRAKMLGQTGLVVVGSSDDCLRMRRRHKMNIGVTQSLVDRAVLEEIGEFLASAIMSPTPPPRPDRQEPPFKRKRRFSTASSADSETSVQPETQAKQLRNALSASNHKPMNGTAGVPGRRGRRAGSGTSRVPRILRDGRSLQNVKTLQTLSPIKRPEREVMNSRGDVTLDIGSIASLAPTGPIVRSGVPQVTPTSTTMQTFRIQAGRVSAMVPNAAPPCDVMPRRLSDSLQSISSTGDEGKQSVLAQNPIRTLDATLPRSAHRPITMATQSRSPRPQIMRPVSRVTLGTTSKVVSSQNNVILVSDKRQASPVTVAAGQNVRMASPLKATTAKIVKTTPTTVLKGSPLTRLSLETRFMHASPSMQQKPIIVSQRSVKSSEDCDLQEKPIVIVKNRNLTEADSEKPMLYLQRSNIIGEKASDNERPMVIIKNRSLSIEGEKKQDVMIDSKRQQIALPQHRGTKQVVLKTEGGEQYILQERPGSTPKFVYKYKIEPDQNEEVVYKVVEG